MVKLCVDGAPAKLHQVDVKKVVYLGLNWADTRLKGTINVAHSKDYRIVK